MATAPESECTLTIGRLVGQALLVLINEYIKQPRDPKWTSIAASMDAQGGALRDEAIMRYIIDLTNDKPLSVVHENHYIRLIRDLGELEVVRIINSLAFGGGNEERQTAQLRNSLKNTLERALIQYF